MSSNSTLPLDFEDLRETFNKALESPSGIRIACPSRKAAIALRGRLHYFRKLDREESCTIYPKTHPSHGRTVYDKLICQVPRSGDPDEMFLYIKPRIYYSTQIEELS